MTGLSLMDKTLVVQGARISFTIWDVGGQLSSLAASNQSYKTQSSSLANRPSIYTLKKIRKIVFSWVQATTGRRIISRSPARMR